MKKTILAFSIATAFAAIDASAFTLPAGAVLSIDAPSKFTMGGSSKYPSDCSGGGVPLSSVTGKGLYVGPNLGDHGSGPHGGFPGPSDRGGSTDMWGFFCNTGVNWMSESVGSGSFSGDTDPLVGADMSSWIVSWSGIEVIPMGSLPFGVSQLTCGVDCSDGDTYTIVHAASVPPGDPSGFGGVRYDVCLTGTITAAASLPPNTTPNTAPTAVDNSYTAGTGSMGVVRGPITRNDTDAEVNDAPDKSTLDLDLGTPGFQSTVTTTLGGTATMDATGRVTYDSPNAGFSGIDTFDYTISDFRGALVSNTATVTFVVGNIAPECNTDTGNADGAFIDITADTFVDIDVLANDTDANGNGTIDKTTVTIVSDVSNGLTSIDPVTGVITYTPTPGFTGPTDSFTYNVTDNDASGVLTCADATVNIIVSNAGPSIGGVDNAFLVLETGNVPDATTKPKLGDGSWFGMEVSPGNLTYTSVSGFNHIQIGTTQLASSVPAVPNIDQLWTFFGNLGLHQTTGDMLQLSNDSAGNATLDFTVWDVSWSGIPSIPMNARAHSGGTNGIGALTCYSTTVGGALGTCADGDKFVVEYFATVPDNDPSGFGNVQYSLHLEGAVSATAPIVGCGDDLDPFDVTDFSIIDDCAASATMTWSPGTKAIAAGNTTGLNLTATDLNSQDPLFNPGDGKQCAGGCLDFVITNVASDHVDIVVKLSAPITSGSVYRKFINGRWHDFDVSNGDEIGSAPVDAVTGNCQGPEGVYRIGLRAGYECLYLKIFDGGPNDADGKVNGTIVDPSGVLLPGSPNTPQGSSSGCSIANTPVTLTKHADWLIVAGFIALMGGLSFRRRHKQRG